MSAHKPHGLGLKFQPTKLFFWSEEEPAGQQHIGSWSRVWILVSTT